MRQDTSVLLGRLGEQNFNYHDFESPSPEIDIWPIFEALLLDERVVGKRPASAAQSTPERTPEPAPQARPRQVRAVGEPVQPGMFGGYAAAKPERSGESVRDMLGRLASNAE